MGSCPEEHMDQTQPTSPIQLPEQDLASIAIKLGQLDRTASGLGKLACGWAMVVLLAGYGSALRDIDFWLISLFIFTEGIRAFTCNRELLWIHRSSHFISFFCCRKNSREHRLHQQIVDVPVNSFPLIHRPCVPNYDDCVEGVAYAASSIQEPRRPPNETLNPSSFYSSSPGLWALVSQLLGCKNFNASIYLYQILSAIAAIGYSVSRIVFQNYAVGVVARNLTNAINLFYALVIAEAAMFLIGRLYWELKINWQGSLHHVLTKRNLGHRQIEIIEELFACIYDSCLNPAVSEDGLERNIVSFSVKKLQSSDEKAQIEGAMALCSVVTGEGILVKSSLRKLGSTEGAIRRLLQIITWKDEQEKEVRKAAACILCSLVSFKEDCFGVAYHSSAIEALVSLVLDQPGNLDQTSCIQLRVIGVSILAELSKKSNCCLKMWDAKELIPALVQFVEVKDLRDATATPDFAFVFSKSLEILRNMAVVTGEFGSMIRNSIAGTKLALRNLRDILQYGSNQPSLQQFAVEIISSLAQEESAKDLIGRTGGIIWLLNVQFLKDAEEGMQEFNAGKALVLLLKDSPKNCRALLAKNGTNILKNLLDQLEKDAKASSYAAKMVSNMWPFLEKEEIEEARSGGIKALKMVVKSKSKLQQEAGLELAKCILSSMEVVVDEEMQEEAIRVSVELANLAPPPPNLPAIRRNALQLLALLVQKKEWTYRHQILRPQVEQLAHTVSPEETDLDHAIAAILALC